MVIELLIYLPVLFTSGCFLNPTTYLWVQGPAYLSAVLTSTFSNYLELKKKKKKHIPMLCLIYFSPSLFKRYAS